jgi:hypothetical protein
MSHISAFKRGEVLLMKKMRFLVPLAPPSSAAKRSYESYFKGDLSAADVEALDDLFPACRRMSGEAVRRLSAMDPYAAHVV